LNFTEEARFSGHTITDTYNQNAKLYKYYEVLIVACVRVVLQKTTEGKH